MPTPKKFRKSRPKPLPKPNVDLGPRKEGKITAEQVRALFCNPLLTGLSGFPKVVSDEEWIRAAAQAIREHGPEQWLVNLLYVLHAFLDETE